MLRLQYTRIMKSFSRNVATGYNIDQEGQALVYVNENGEVKVRPSSGAAGEKFAGVAISQANIPGTLCAVEPLVGNGSTTLKLSRGNVVAGQIAVRVGGNLLTHAASASAGKFAVDLVSGVITLDASDAGTALAPVEVTAYYKYVPSMPEAINAQGQVVGGGGITAASYYSVTGIITEGDVATDYFDVTDDWTKTEGPVFLGPNGIFTLKSGGTELKGANVIAAPASPNGQFFSAYLVLNFGPYSGA